jgi:GPH family glycoside/pentoside/hexuronide:cation symporter
MWAMPYYSLMLEMTPSYDERTRIAGVRSFFCQLSVLVGGWVLAIATSKHFADPVTGEPDIANGMRTVSIWLAALVTVLAVIPAFFVKERYYEKETKKQEKIPLIQGLKDTIANRPLMLLIGIVVFQVFGSGVVNTLGQYINTYYINGGELAKAFTLEGWKATAACLTGIVSIFFWTWVCERLDKKWALMIILACGFIGALLNIFCLTPEYPYLQLVPTVFSAGVIGALWLIVPSMQADAADYDESVTGKRREGSINSVFSWFLKLAFACAGGLSGFVLEWTGFDVAAGKVQPDGVLQNMLICFIVFPIVFWLLAIVMLWFYPLDRKRMDGIRVELENRRGKL